MAGKLTGGQREARPSSAAERASSAAAAMASSWLDWIAHLGHDVYSYPSWISDQMRGCTCDVKIDPRTVECVENGKSVSWQSAVAKESSALTYCVGKSWLLEHMPSFDMHFLPNGVSVNATSMLDDVLAFALMADAAAAFSPTIPLSMKLAYVLPYGAYHESRQNWRPLFFAKFFSLVQNATSVEEALGRLLHPNAFLEWSSHYWPSSPRQPGEDLQYKIKWSSSTAPPVVSPLEFVAYGYGSCSAWATYVTYVSRAVGIPARQAGTPCWNSVYGGYDYRGLSSGNSNVSLCWNGGSDQLGHGGGFLNNHNWAEIWLPGEGNGWTFVNVPPQSKEPDAGLCGASFSPSKGCCGKRPGDAMQDHEIFAITWSKPGEEEEEMVAVDEGGPVLSVAGKTLTDGKTPLTPLVWAPRLTSPLGQPMKDVGLRVVNRTEFYRCKA